MMAGGGTQSKGSEDMSEGWSFLTLVREEALKRTCEQGPFQQIPMNTINKDFNNCVLIR